MAEKRKKIVLTIKEKLEVVDRFEKGEPAAKLAKEYGIGEQTVRDIKKNKNKLIEFSSQSGNGQGSSKRKSMRKSPYEELDKAMLEWLNQKRAEGISVSGHMCTNQARLFHKSLELDGDFNASSGWLSRFKQRYGIIEITSQRGRGDDPAISKFCKEFLQFVEKEHLCPEQIYNANETGLYWKGAPEELIAFEKKEQTNGSKAAKERITVMCCSNATGQHKLKVLAIVKLKKSRLFKDSDLCEFPVECYYQGGGCIDPDIFKDWFHEKFVPQVKCHLQCRGLPQRAVLLIDNSLVNRKDLMLKSNDGSIFVKYLPPDLSTLVLPMNQGIIMAMKRNYRNNLVLKDDAKVVAVWEQNTILDALLGISMAWDQVKPPMIIRSWKKLLPDLEENDFEEFSDDLSNSELDALLYDNDGCGNIDSKNLKEWLESDICETDYKELKGSYSILRTISEAEPKDGVDAKDGMKETKEEAETVCLKQK
ncbi:hypothetical protein J437_LFUL015743 [Ladona fulva]|uniref:Uncharacterized protein n=1 Tax=Ladona fulva TaxID=123851 RepID=A0A8K0KHU5_LADFU|nr:hypothetical protein J437_LFUL015743 [Ladona fulva]